MKRIYVPTQDASDWQRLLAKPDLHWKPSKSAMTTAVCWDQAGDRLPPEVGRVLDSAGDASLRGLKLLAAIPEWETELPGGKTASMTDVMALASNEAGLVVIGVEGKVDEAFGPTLGEKRAEQSAGQSERLAFLQRTLMPHGAPFADPIRYQLLHRTASALLTARDFHARTAVMLVHSFGVDASLKQDYAAFCKAMGAREVGQHVCAVDHHSSPRLFLAWCEGDKQHLKVDARKRA